ncbi:MAG TPA: glycosyltransferase family 25 protein [Chlamydiales bacterium]|nr:glycosyltransferase family 25 protein [Chlamydiales bacterium]
MFKLLIICLAAHLYGEYKVEGFSDFYDDEKRYFLISTFLPHNPKIFTDTSEALEICSRYWPSFSRSDLYDFLWLENDPHTWIVQNPEMVKQARIIYIGSLESDFQKLKYTLECFGYVLLTRWYWESGKGHALFLKRNYYDATMRTLVYLPANVRPLPKPAPSNIEQFFKKAEGKSDQHKIKGIDYLYMINLDERPEKFLVSTGELQLYGINPYRFSAVNGWKLPTSILSQLGAQFLPGTLQDAFLGSYYLEIDGKEYMHTELIQENGTAYFMRGLSKGAIGIILSHLSILQDALDLGYETIWVMEDDVEVVKNPTILSDLIEELDHLDPQWDILFTDTDTKNTKGEHVACRALAARPNVEVPPLSHFLQNFYPVSTNLSRTGMRYGAYSMILRRSGIKKILEYYKRYRLFIPYDMDYWLISDIRMYHPNWDIISHRAGAASDNGDPNYKKKEN